jgi:hypothetical protein
MIVLAKLEANLSDRPNILTMKSNINFAETLETLQNSAPYISRSRNNTDNGQVSVEAKTKAVPQQKYLASGL